jgi:hypothetical protein
MLTVALRGYGAVCPTSREEHRPGTFENGMLRKILGHKKEELTRDWRKLHNEELHRL